MLFPYSFKNLATRFVMCYTDNIQTILNNPYNGKLSEGNVVFEKNTRKINSVISKMFAACSAFIIVMGVLSILGIFEFGTAYTAIVLIAGLVICISPTLLIRVLSPNVMKYYMLTVLSVFIGILGTSNHIGIYITYALVPIFSCLYFDPAFTVRMSVIAYLVMAVSVFVSTRTNYEVLYMGKSHFEMFVAYLLGFTIEFAVVSMILFYLVKLARKMMEERNNAEERNEMKSRVLSNVSHEIRTPMNAILGMADVALRDGDKLDAETRKCLNVIRTSSKGLLEIINDILDMSKIEAGKLDMINDRYSVKSLVDDMTVIINARNVDKKIPLFYHIQDNIPPYLEGDAVRIKQVMFNFASNAIKYTDSGRIDITLSCSDVQNDSVYMTYTVQDTGIGIRSEDIDRIFEMYSRVDVEKNHSKEGTGIGLTISKYFVEQMNGEIEVESEYGKGSTFSFTVPQKVIHGNDSEFTAKCGISATTDILTDNFVTKGAKILLVDDNEINREVVIAMLEPLRIDIDEAENGAESVRLAEKVKYDIIFMDSHMPVMNGEEATRNIRTLETSQNRSTPIIALTADAIAGVRERLIAAGMDDYLVKPITIPDITGIIVKYLPADKIESVSEQV